MDDKIKEVKLAILDRILANVTDKEKALSGDTLSTLASIVNNFDTTEELKKKYPVGLFGNLEPKAEEPKPETETL